MSFIDDVINEEIENEIEKNDSNALVSYFVTEKKGRALKVPQRLALANKRIKRVRKSINLTKRLDDEITAMTEGSQNVAIEALLQFAVDTLRQQKKGLKVVER